MPLVYVHLVGFLSRLIIPRSVRRAVHPVRAIKRELTPRPIKNARRALSPIDNALYGIERSIFTKSGRGSSSNSEKYFHEGCDVAHRTQEAAQRCRKGSNQQFVSNVEEPNQFESSCPRCSSYINVKMDNCPGCNISLDWEISHTGCGGTFSRRLAGEAAYLRCSRCNLEFGG